MKIYKLPVYLGIIFLICGLFAAGYISYPLLHSDQGLTKTLARIDLGQNNIMDHDLYREAWTLLERDFVDNVPDRTARTYGSIRGLTDAFGDPYTVFVEPESREIKQSQLQGHYAGIGANIEQTEEGYRLYPIPEQPAEQAGLLDRDLLLLVDDKEITAEMDHEELITLVRGPVGTTVDLLIRRDVSPTNTDQSEASSSVDSQSESQELTIQIVRDIIETPSMEWRLLNPEPFNDIEELTAYQTDISSIGYIKQSIFSERSPDEMILALAELTEQGATRFIFDLRGNPGGLVDAAVRITDMWLDSGIVLYEEAADGTEKIFEATQGTEVGDSALVLLVDGGSASASEIVAGALQDHERAILVGEHTFGKGSVQLIHKLSDQSSLHITNARWSTPNRHQIDGKGLIPDKVVEQGLDPIPAAIIELLKFQER